MLLADSSGDLGCSLGDETYSAIYEPDKCVRLPEPRFPHL